MLQARVRAHVAAELRAFDRAIGGDQGQGAVARHAAHARAPAGLVERQDFARQRIGVELDRQLHERELQFHRGVWFTLARGCGWARRSEEHTSELQSLMRISYAVFCLKKKTHDTYQ